MSGSMMPRARWTAPRMRPLAHSWSSRTSTRRSVSPFSSRALTAATEVSLTRALASWTSFRKAGEWSTARLAHSVGRMAAAGLAAQRDLQAHLGAAHRGLGGREGQRVDVLADQL